MSCVAAVVGGTPAGQPARQGCLISGNTFPDVQQAVDLSNVANVQVMANQSDGTSVNPGCSSAAAVQLADVNGATIEGNNFGDARAVASIRAVANLIECGNELDGGGFNRPAACPT